MADTRTMTALRDVETILKTYGAQLLPRIHVIAARYGDIRDFHKPRSEGRWCDARDAMSAHCERAGDCKLPTAPETSLCGYDPVPNADPRFKFLIVRYSCHLKTDADWADITLDPDAEDIHVHTAELRSPMAKVICDPSKLARQQSATPAPGSATQ